MSQESEKKKDPNPNNIGGQAVIEGVMMRGKEIYAMAVRNPEGGITVEKKEWGGLGKKGLFRFPIFVFPDSFFLILLFLILLFPDSSFSRSAHIFPEPCTACGFAL